MNVIFVTRDGARIVLENLEMTRRNCYKISRKFGFIIAAKAFLYRAFPAKILYGLFDKIHCSVCIYDSTGILLRSSWITAKSEFLKYRIPNEKNSEGAIALLTGLEANQLF